MKDQQRGGRRFTINRPQRIKPVDFSYDLTAEIEAAILANGPGRRCYETQEEVSAKK